MKTRSHTTVRAGQLFVLAGIAAALAMSAGCDRRTASGKAVSSSSKNLQTVLSPSSSTAEGGKTWASKQYDQVIKDVKDSGGSGLAGENAAAKLLQAESQLGLAEQPFTTATRLEADVDNRVTVLRSILASWIAENAHAAAAALYDPTSTIAQSETSAKEFDAKADEASKRRDTLAGQIKDLETQAGAKLAQVQAEEASIAQMRDQAATVKATEAAKIIEEISQKRKAADGVRTEGSMLQARADQMQPQFRESELLVQQFQAQAKTYRDLIEDMRKREAVKKEEASKARGAAAAAGQEIDRQLEELSQVRSGKLQEAYSAAIQAYQTALTSVKAARQDDNAFGAAKITEGNIQQGLGDAHWAKAQGLLRFEAIIGRLAQVKPALPKAAAYAQEATKAKEAAAEELNAAKDAYDAAANAYKGAKLKGEAQKSLELLGSKLEAISKITGGQGMDALASLAMGTFKPKEEAEAEAAPAPTEGEPAAATAAVEADPNAPVTAMIESMLGAIRSGDQAALAGMVQSPSPELSSLMVAQLQGVGVMLKLDAACMEKFQARFSEKLIGMAQGMGQQASFDPVELAKLADLKAADVVTSVEGDNGTATLPGLREKLNIRKVDGTWKLVAPEAATAMPVKQLELTAKITDITNEVMTAITAQVQAGNFESLDAAFQAFSTQVAAKAMPIMQQMQQNQGGGGGG